MPAPAEPGRSITFFECWKVRAVDMHDASDAASGLKYGAAGDLASLLDWVGEGAYPLDPQQVRVSRDADGRFAREVVRVDFPYHRDNWESDNFFAYAREKVRDMNESVEAWLVKMRELRGMWESGKLS